MITKKQTQAAERVVSRLDDVADDLSTAVAQAEQINESMRRRILKARKDVDAIIADLQEKFIYRDD